MPEHREALKEVTFRIILDHLVTITVIFNSLSVVE